MQDIFLKKLHIHPGPVDLVRGQLGELHDREGESFDNCEETPDKVGPGRAVHWRRKGKNYVRVIQKRVKKVGKNLSGTTKSIM